MKKQSILTGAIILAVSNTVSKILGAVLKIPLTYIIGEEGMAIYNSAFNIYIMFLSFVVSGLPFAVSKLVSEYSSVKKYSMLRHTVKTVNIILIILGAVGSAALYFGAEFFALAMKEEKAVTAIRMIAPSILFVAMGATIRSYYQGISNMIPTAISQIIESVTKLVAGYILAKKFISVSVAAASGGAVLGVTLGEAVATAVFLLIYVLSKKEKYICSAEERSEVYRAVSEIAVPLLFSAVISSMLSVVDTTVMRSGLIKSGLDTESARKIYGAYTGYAMTVFHLPVGILGTLGVSLLPVISGAFATNDRHKAQTAFSMAVKLTMTVSLPCSVILFCMGDSVLNILFKNTGSANMLMAASPLLTVICMGNILTSVVQAAGKIMPVFVYSTAGTVLKIAMSVFLMPKYGIYGAIMSSAVTAVFILMMSMIISKKTGLKFEIWDTIIKPIFSASVMLVMIWLVRMPILNIVNGELLRVCIISFISCTAYMMMLIITGVFGDKNQNRLLKKTRICGILSI